MALYKYAQNLGQSKDDIFDNVYSPGALVPRSGIYRCTGCGREAACNQGDPLPPQNHHQHTPATAPIRWKLIVFADHRPK